MRTRYDPQQNVAHIRLGEERAEAEALRISDELNIDLAPDGTVYGIELLNANEQPALGADGKLPFVDQARGIRIIMDGNRWTNILRFIRL